MNLQGRMYVALLLLCHFHSIDKIVPWYPYHDTYPFSKAFSFSMEWESLNRSLIAYSYTLLSLTSSLSNSLCKGRSGMVEVPTSSSSSNNLFSSFGSSMIGVSTLMDGSKEPLWVRVISFWMESC